MTHTVVMPVYNRTKHTKQSIVSLYESSKDTIHLIVVDDRSHYSTHNSLKALQKKYGFHLIRNDKNIGVGASKNVGIEYAILNDLVNDLIYISDNDVYFKENALEIMTDVYTKVRFNGIGLLGGGCHPYLQTNSITKVGEYELHFKDAISGYSHLLSKELWFRFGPYDEYHGDDKKTGRSEDWAICQRMKEGGFRVASLVPEVVISTGATDSYGDDAIGKETFTTNTDIFIG